MHISPSSPFGPRIIPWTRFVLSAALVALAFRVSAREPLTAALFGAFFVLSTIPAYLARRRASRVLRSGDIRSVLSVWARNIARLPYPETMGPLVTAAAFASCGWVDQARTALDRSVRGPAWEAALEHRLFVETLLDAFEGERDAALSKALQLGSLPVPTIGFFAAGRVRSLRGALAAFARAFAHTSTPADLTLLERESKKSPLMYWAMRYAAAVVAIDHGEHERARRMLGTAPPWPEGSAFNAFHQELSGILDLRAEA
ncbi:MAG TPA: hypothetical protein VJT73_09540 [Polyangiaceae bacterium]|nr:hypothetical protein [Polyangiaceae bacterium]